MSQNNRRKGPDGLQKLFLYLILFEWMLLLYTSVSINKFSFRQGFITLALLLGFNLILGSLCQRRARRHDDGYIIYPVLAGGLLSFILLMLFMF